MRIYRYTSVYLYTSTVVKITSIGLNMDKHCGFLKSLSKYVIMCYKYSHTVILYTILPQGCEEERQPVWRNPADHLWRLSTASPSYQGNRQENILLSGMVSLYPSLIIKLFLGIQSLWKLIKVYTVHFRVRLIQFLIRNFRKNTVL